ncbi:MAG: hypothetical protein ACJ75T_02450 [Solirubrobacterales bacterium]
MRGETDAAMHELRQIADRWYFAAIAGHQDDYFANLADHEDFQQILEGAPWPALKSLERGADGFEPTTAGTTIRPPLGDVSSELLMASGFAPVSVAAAAPDVREYSAIVGRKADFCLIGHTPVKQQSRPYNPSKGEPHTAP